MSKFLFSLAALILAFPAFSGEPRINTTRDSGSYESTLRNAGIPLSGGMAWAGHAKVPGELEAIQMAAAKHAPAPVVTVAKSTKVGKDS